MKQLAQKSMLALLFMFLATFSNSVLAQKEKKQKDYYLIKVYHCKSSDQVNMVNDYLEKAYLPALHQHGCEKIGVFTRYDNDTATDKRVYVFIPNTSVKNLLLQDDVLLKDANLQKNGAVYLQAAYNMPPYQRIETIVLRAFKDHPLFALPKLTGPLTERIYELRSYEGSNETFYRQKVKMFNEGGEISIFKNLNFNAVFYAEVLSGCHMPDLMYMTTFNNMADRDAHWKAFGDSPAWKTLSALPEYQHTVSTANIYLLHPTGFSDF
ncbi:NIPSNAP family protein [Hydrotalea sp.]|uniref:NIPSNAP family protein n=1 Tax=Hydrotalea sp. TaxID=2881279 RepID=UPI00261D352A|nr:NIPSNAP family protein [Hydrotalea sp.]